MESQDRRDSELTDLKRRLAVLKARTDSLERQTNGMHYAMFGIPDDRNSNGLVGSMHELSTKLDTMNANVSRLLVAAICALGGATVDIVTRHL